MQIANPIYDAAFKYLMQDDQVARLLVGRIADLEVASLDLRPQETAQPREDGNGDGGKAPPLALFRMDFAARVRTPEGAERQVLIEIQKTNAPTTVERFRNYLGQQMCNPENVIMHPSGRREAVPIVTIYLLGYDLRVSEEAVLDVFPQVRERRTGRELGTGHPFIAGIHHRSHVVQIPRLRGRRRDELERLLSIFDQGKAQIERGGTHVLNVDEREYPSEYGFVLRRLHRAVADEKVRQFMEGEDRLLLDSISWGMQAEHERQRAEQERQRAEQERRRAEQERQRAEQERRRAEQEKQRAEQEKQRADLAEREKAQEARRAEQAGQDKVLAERVLSRSIRHLHGLGQDAEEIALALSINVQRVRRVLAASEGEDRSA